MSRFLNTSIDAVEEWDIDKLMAYRAAWARAAKQERSKRG